MAAALTLFGAAAQKLSPNAEALLLNRQGAGMHSPSVRFKPLSVTDSVAPEKVKVFINYAAASALDSVESLGGRVYQTFDTYATAEVPVDNLRAVSELGGVRFVEMGSPVHLCNDIAREISGINAIHTNKFGSFEQGYTGSGIVVGVIDTGLDYTHVAFRNADGSLRIKRVWNQNATGKAPAAFGYGSELKDEDEIKAACTDSRSQYHGSHTTGIAAGGDRTSSFYGMAPDADIVFVSFGQNSVDIPNAVKYIFDYAEEVGKPCVINMSLGSHKGPHNGQSALDRYFESAVGPGRLLVGSVGNEGISNLHIGKDFTATDTQLKTILEMPSGSNKATALDIWGTAGSEFTVKLVLTDAKGKVLESTTTVPSTATKASVASFSDDNFDGYFYIIPSNEPDTDAPNVYVECYINALGDTRNVGVVIEGQDGASVNMWNLGLYSFVSGGFRGYSAGDKAMTAGEIGGTGEAVISVGSYNSRFTFPCWAEDPNSLFIVDAYGPDVIPTGEVSFFSSCGPTADGRMKPDVLAPGALVISAMNSYCPEAEQYPTQMVGRTVDSAGKSHYYYLNIGTSMSSPVVAGGLALWLEADPMLTPEKVRDYISRSSRLDSYTGSEPGNTAGYGKFDAYQGLSLVLDNLSSIDGATADGADERAWYESAGRSICVASVAGGEVNVYSITGALAGIHRVAPGLSRIDTSALTAGIYILRFANTGRTVKIAVR